MEGDSSIHFLNVSYFFRLIYDLLTGGNVVTGQDLWTDLLALAASVWVVITILAFLVSLAALAVLIHSTVRMLDAKRREAPLYATQHAAVAETRRDHNRWNHIMTLIESPHENDWRQAIIEADIMLDDLLSQLGYHGIGVGEKLRAVDPSRFKTLQNAWEAHKIRNEIAHQGSAFPLTDHVAYRTIHNYEAVMREHGEI